MRAFFKRLKRVRVNDIKQLWKLPIAIIATPFYRKKHKDLWLVCEAPTEARDNGYWFFKYVREKHPEQDCVYAIKKESADLKKITALGNIVEYGSLMHWIMYLASSKKISSQKSGNPNAAIFYFLEVYGILKDKRVFLQHGVIKDDLKWLYYEVTKMNRFICGAYPEYQYVKNNYGYPEENIRYTGLCRFDGLHNAEYDKKLILIMPTWREWIADEDSRMIKYEGTRNVLDTNYFKKWTEFITSKEIEQISKKYNVKFVFFLHREMQKYINYLPKSNAYLEVAKPQQYGVQELLKKASLMITDYSSVFFDFIYMKKPVIFYQFDYEIFRKLQYGEGYFDYRNNPFGKSFIQAKQVFEEIEKIIESEYKISEEFTKAHRNFFPLYDTKNCERVFDVVKEC